ncbi:MAG: 4'-phosphopantetheinyl transferase superfamily protein [Saprospiraceae bacterium]|nr:4'-phosphopantetheinyl transferase superfamily protein [Saprospiraceae bacterium]
MSYSPFDFTNNELGLYYFRIYDFCHDGIIQSLISEFSVKDQHFLNSIQNKDVQKRTLFGRIILKYIAIRLEIGQPDFVSITKSGRPTFTLPNGFDFNISHSEKMVACCLVNNSIAGIDLEFNKSINIDTYRNCFSLKEWHFIKKSENPDLSFFRLWVRKEAVIKADGRGFGLNLSLINCLENVVEVGLSSYFIENINIETDYSCAIACNKKKTIKLIDFNKIFNSQYYFSSQL